MKLKIWQVDAFASKPLEGNPAAIVPLDAWLADDLMQAIAGENNLAETAFFVKTGMGSYDLRWFTPNSEVDLCGHATLASAWVIFNRIDMALTQARFMTRSGELMVTRGNNGNVMSLPSYIVRPYSGDAAARIGAALGVAPPHELHSGTYLMAVWNDAATVRAIAGPGGIAPVLEALGFWGLIATAPGDSGYDCVSRFFAPAKAVPEDPVTGSAHCALTPFWAKRLGKKTLKARQASPRGGDLICTDDGARAIIQGDCALYLTGEIEV
ncbi:MAG TPA: PhzF family phenazine biosynthesis protein [Rhizomicrobium sp.]|nr:PhzF family phenazine biosynthesis protein [Rhizomicrobium sp.]